MSSLAGRAATEERSTAESIGSLLQGAAGTAGEEGTTFIYTHTHTHAGAFQDFIGGLCRLPKLLVLYYPSLQTYTMSVHFDRLHFSTYK